MTARSTKLASGTVAVLRAILARGVVRNAAALLSAEAVTRALSIVTIALVSRIVGPAEIGLLAIAQAITMFGVVVGGGGITTVAQREVAADHATADRVVSAATVAQLLLGSAAAVGVVAAVWYLPLPDGTFRLVLVLLPLLIVHALSLIYVLQAVERMIAAAWVKVIVQAVWSGLGIALVVITGDVVWYAVAIPTSVLIGGLVSIAILARTRVLTSLRFDFSEARQLVTGGLPLLGTTLLGQLFLVLDIVVLGVLRPPHEVGEYNAAFRLVLFLITLSGVLGQAAFPQLVRRFHDARASYARLLGALIRLTAHLALPVCAFLLLESISVVGFVYGAEFAGSGLLLAILAIWIPLGFYNNLSSIALIAAGLQGTVLRIVIAGAVVMAVGLYVLVPPLGAAGAAVTVILRESVMLALFSLVVRRTLRISALAHLFGQVPWFIGPFVTVFALRLIHPDASILLAGVVWAAAVLLLEWVSGWPLYRELTGVRPASIR